MPDRRTRRQEEREAKAKEAKQEFRPPGGLFSRLSTDAIVGIIIASVVLLVFLVFFFRWWNSRDNTAAPTFNQVSAIAPGGLEGKTLFIADLNGLFRSTDNGKKWSRAPGIAKGEAYRAVEGVPGSPGALIAAGSHSLRRSADGGKTWTLVQNDLPSQDFQSFTIDPVQSNTFYAYLNPQGLFRSENSGAAWTRVSGFENASVTTLAVRPGDPKLLFAFHSSRGLLRSRDGGVTFEPVTGTLPATSVTDLLTLPNDAQNVYAVASRSLYRSKDGGTTWAKAGGQSLSSANIVTIGRDGATGTLYAADLTGFVYSSTDGGENWIPHS